MRLMLFILISFSFATNQTKCNETRRQTRENKNIHGYLLVGYPVKNLDSVCLRNLSGALLKNSCIIAMDKYFINAIPDFDVTNDFDSAYKKDAQFETNGGIIITRFDKRFTGSDISELLKDSTFRDLQKEILPRTKLTSTLYFNKNSVPQTFVYRIFEFDASYNMKKIKNTIDAQNLIEGMTNLVYDNIKTEMFTIIFINSLKYLKEVSISQFKSKNFIPIN